MKCNSKSQIFDSIDSVVRTSPLLSEQTRIAPVARGICPRTTKRALWGTHLFCSKLKDRIHGAWPVSAAQILSNFSKISINFCIQYSIFQHFSKSTHFCKILQKILQIFANFSDIRKIFAKCCRIFAEFFCNFVDFEKC